MNGRAALSLFCLAPRGVCRAVRLPGFAVGSYSTISPLPVPLRAIGGIFLLHFPSGILAFPVPHFHEARCPVVSGLSSPPLARNCDRPGSGARKVAEQRLFSNQNQTLKIRPGKFRQIKEAKFSISSVLKIEMIPRVLAFPRPAQRTLCDQGREIPCRGGGGGFRDDAVVCRTQAAFESPSPSRNILSKTFS